MSLLKMICNILDGEPVTTKTTTQPIEHVEDVVIEDTSDMYSAAEDHYYGLDLNLNLDCDTD